MNHRQDPPFDSEADESFVQRWSRRKHEAYKTPEAVAPAEVKPAPPQSEPEPEPLGDEDMPPLDSLGPGSDVSPFFSPRVSESLRQAALQCLFRQPQFNYQDGLDVYCGNYRNFKPLGDIVTAAMRHRIEAARQRLAQLTEQADPEAVDAATGSAASADAGREETRDHANAPEAGVADSGQDPTGAPVHDPSDDNNGHA